jgi:hypothetical protein
VELRTERLLLRPVTEDDVVRHLGGELYELRRAPSSHP